MIPALDAALEAAARAHDAHKRAVSHTGAVRQNVGKLRIDILPPSWLRALARVLGKGAEKYADRNWEKGLPFMATLASAERHILAFKSGEDIDPDTGEPHAALAAWNMLALVEFQRRMCAGTLPVTLDDRPIEWSVPVPPPERARPTDAELDAAQDQDAAAQDRKITPCEDCSNARACNNWGRCISQEVRQKRANQQFSVCSDCPYPEACSIANFKICAVRGTR
jgi:hypothetical protein